MLLQREHGGGVVLGDYPLKMPQMRSKVRSDRRNPLKIETMHSVLDCSLGTPYKMACTFYLDITKFIINVPV